MSTTLLAERRPTPASPFKRQLHPMRRLLAFGLNELLAQGLLSLQPGDEAPGYVLTTIAGKRSMVVWQPISHGELRLTVWWGFDPTRHPQIACDGAARESFRCERPLAHREQYNKFVAVTVSCWIERHTGAWLQGRGADYLFGKYVRRSSRRELESIPDPTPTGFAPEGRFFR